MAHGYLDGARLGQVMGWVWDPERPQDRLDVEVRLDGELMGCVRADLERPDLLSESIGDGRYGFVLDLPLARRDGRHHDVDASVGGVPLSRSPWRGRVGTADARAGAPTFRSRLGGLWTDLSNAQEVIDGQLGLGWIDEAEADLLRAWVRDGYVIIRGAVPPSDIEELRRDIDRLEEDGSEDVWVESFADAEITYETLRPAHTEQFTKVLDLHAHFESARRAAFSEPVARALSLFFQRPALAFQSLYFRRGVNQPLHRDTAYVRLSSPVELVAAWVALEPIRAGSGELELYAGSHDLPEMLVDGQKWLPDGEDDPEDSGLQLRAQCEEAGLRHERFLAEPGDVLLWSADLVHGGSHVLDESVTRRSFVVHYCPSHVDPIYGGGAAPRFEHAPGLFHTYSLR